MNTKNNRRKQASISRIQQAFIRFLQDKELSQITVAEICKEAAINRSTFYAHYADIYDLSNQFCQELEKAVSQLLVPKSGWQQSKQEFLNLLLHIQEHQDLYKVFFMLNYDNHNLVLYSTKDLQTVSDINLIDYHIAFFRGGFNTIIKLWLQNDCRETPEQICQMLLNEYRGRFEMQ